MQLGFVGLGAMGLPMTRHLVEAGHRVTVSSRSPGPVAAGGGPRGRRRSRPGPGGRGQRRGHPLRPQFAPGGRGGGGHAARPGTGEGGGGLLHHRSRGGAGPARPGGRHRRRRSSTPPCPGGTAGAEAGTLTLMVGGDERRRSRRCDPALDPFAGLIVHVGGPGMGQVVKLCNNLIYAAQMVATAEASALAVTSGVDMAQAPRGAAPLAPGTAWPCGPGCRWPAWCRTARPPTGGGPAS